MKERNILVMRVNRNIREWMISDIKIEIDLWNVRMNVGVDNREFRSVERRIVLPRLL
jgi:hypothetical protein